MLRYCLPAYLQVIVALLVRVQLIFRPFIELIGFCLYNGRDIVQLNLNFGNIVE